MQIRMMLHSSPFTNRRGFRPLGNVANSAEALPFKGRCDCGRGAPFHPYAESVSPVHGSTGTVATNLSRMVRKLDRLEIALVRYSLASDGGYLAFELPATRAVASHCCRVMTQRKLKWLVPVLTSPL